MDIKIKTNISSDLKETSIVINAPVLTTQLEEMIQYITNMDTTPNQIVANQNNKIYVIDVKDIICFFSNEKSNYVRTKDGTYKIQYKLYELEERFGKKDFIRISNSCIIHINQVVCFDTSILGTILVKLKDNTQETVSKRNVSQIMKLLKNRGRLK